jgi:hypothetical protein
MNTSLVEIMRQALLLSEALLASLLEKLHKKFSSILILEEL